MPLVNTGVVPNFSTGKAIKTLRRSKTSISQIAIPLDGATIDEDDVFQCITIDIGNQRFAFKPNSLTPQILERVIHHTLNILT
ncbi:hypothetical protein BFS86_05220 [Shewanella algae]|nr:hypothetical protein BFS86_05220 [Shewanella algae]